MAATRKQTKRSLTTVRRTIQTVSIFGALLLGVRHVMPGRESTGGAFDAFCPMGGVETFLPWLLTGHTLRTTNLLNFAILIGGLAVALLAGRAFCGWLCPVGGVQDWLAQWARRLSGEKRHIRGKRSRARLPLMVPAALDSRLRYLKYGILGLVLLASLAAVYPPLHSFCPARALFSLRLTPLLTAVLLTFIVTSVLVERFWCKYLCPLGAFLSLYNRFAPLRVRINAARCTQCGRCETECPMGLALVDEDMRSPECIQCLECVETCALPEAIDLKLG